VSSGPLQLATIIDALACRRLSLGIELVDSVTSTNDLAWRRVDEGSPDGLVILAEHQSAGRGRFGRTWHAPRGGSVLCSVVIRDETDRLKGGLVGLIAAVAACDAIRTAADVPAEIHWPNDLIVHQRKVGGVLVESRPGSRTERVFVVGIGINCLQHAVHFPPELRDRATSLELESRDAIDRSAVCRCLLGELDAWLAAPERWQPETVRTAWLQRAAGIGQPIRLRHGGREYNGVVVDLDPTSALIVQLDQGGRMAFDADRTTVLSE
jgi:BirA family biotin operon repressor/biotin-[acetyl-CoA-carboxylase] ligase